MTHANKISELINSKSCVTPTSSTNELYLHSEKRFDYERGTAPPGPDALACSRFYTKARVLDAGLSAEVSLKLSGEIRSCIVSCSENIPLVLQLLPKKIQDCAGESLNQRCPGSSTDAIRAQIAPAPGSLSNIMFDQKVEIGQLLKTPHLLQYGQVSREYNKAMQRALQNRTTGILAPELALPAMATLGKVRCLKLKICHATDDKMALIGQLINLHTLNLEGTGITDAGLRRLNNLSNLHSLDLRHAKKITDTGLLHLKNLPNLHTLNLRGINVTDAGLLHLNNLPKLHTFNLGGTGITDAGLYHLKNLSNLCTLNLEWTKITDAGLLHLNNLPNLHTVNLSRTDVTNAGLQKLQKDLPNLTVRR